MKAVESVTLEMEEAHSSGNLLEDSQPSSSPRVTATDRPQAKVEYEGRTRRCGQSTGARHGKHRRHP